MAGYGISKAGSIAVAVSSGREFRSGSIILPDTDGKAESAGGDAACPWVFTPGSACADSKSARVSDAWMALLGICNAAADRVSSPLAPPCN